LNATTIKGAILGFNSAWFAPDLKPVEPPL